MIAKPKNDIYVALLGIALGAVLIACILLMLEMSDYEWTVNPKVSMAPSSADTPRQAVAWASESSTTGHGGSVCVEMVTAEWVHSERPAFANARDVFVIISAF